MEKDEDLKFDLGVDDEMDVEGDNPPPLTTVRVSLALLAAALSVASAVACICLVARHDFACDICVI